MPETWEDDLLAAHRPGGTIAVGPAGPVTLETLCGQVERIASAVAGHRAIIVACGDRAALAASFLACMQVGVPALFPPGLKLEVVRELERATGAIVLHDQDLPLGMDIRTLLEGTPRLARLCVPFAAERMMAVFHTSGTTGAPVAHAKTGAQLVLEARMQAARLALCEGDRVLATVPAHHLYGFLFGVLVPLSGGAAFGAATPVSPAAVAAERAALGANVLVSVPAHLRAIAALAPAELRAAFRVVISSGAALDREGARVVAEALGVAAEEVLGSTETGGIATRKYPNDAYRPLPGVHVKSKGGVLEVASPYVCMPDGEAAVATSDRIHLANDGSFIHLGRTDDVVKVGGKRVALGEVEARLRAIQGVRDAVVRAEASTTARGRRVVAIVEGDHLDAAALRAELAKHLDDVVVPRRIVVVSAIPRTDTGKLRESTVRELLGVQVPKGPELHRREGDLLTYDVHVPVDLPVFAGHFPGDPLLPGVLQLRDVALSATRREFPELSSLERLTRVKFKRPIRPGQDLVLVLSRREPTTVHFRIT
ncbi:MAG: AMP-binding protein, partial [Polyangiaceae bacterium]|nr:AMP-binding protein [Polyangiaceae bacterium]